MNSEDAAYWAGFCLLLGYGYNPSKIDPNNSKIIGTGENSTKYLNAISPPSQTWINWGIERGGYARQIFRVMNGKSAN